MKMLLKPTIPQIHVYEHMYQNVLDSYDRSAQIPF